MADGAIYFVSDTHLGDGTGADRFRYPREFLQLLNRIEAEPGAQLVLLGDFMELWACALDAVLIRHAPVFTALARMSERHLVTFVVGNHDCLPWYYFIGKGLGNVRVAERFVAARGALVALHGHQFDPFNKVEFSGGQVKAPWVRRLVHVLGFVERLGGEAVGHFADDAGAALEKAAGALDQLLPDWDEADRSDLCHTLTRAREALLRQSPGDRGYPSGESIYEEAACQLMRAGARFVLMGHTHHPLQRRYGQKVYVNTGCWVWDRYPPTYARFASGRLDLLRADTHELFA